MASPFTVFSDGFTDADAAELYDELCPWDVTAHPENPFVLDLVLKAGSVLDVGCGTGSLLHAARAAGHTGRLAGIDPDPSMLARAMVRDDVEWTAGTAADIAWQAEFDLATMTSNAFMCLVSDAEVRASLAAIRAALHVGGRFVFGTRHVRARGWREWTPENGYDVTMPDGRELRQWHQVEAVEGSTVTFTEYTGRRDGTVLHAGRCTLRFWDAAELGGFLAEAGFEVAGQYGDWRRGPVTGESREIVSVARAI
jgi:SAM-dependent methyltransferase